MTRKKASLLFLLMVLPWTVVRPWFEEFKQSVRGRAMGNSLGTSWNGVDSMYYNPASIAHTNTAEFSGAFAEPAGGFSNFDDGSSINQIDFAGVFPFNNPINLKTAGWKNDFITTGAGFGLSFIQQAYNSGDNTAGVTQRYVGITYAKNLDNLLFQGARISAGITTNVYMLSFEGTDITNNAAFKNKSSTAVSPDLGINYNFSDFILVSLVMENLIPTSISPFEDGEKLSRNMNIGVSWEFGSIGKLPFLQDILMSGNWKIVNPADQGKNATANIASSNFYQAGWESWQKFPRYIDIAFRAGFGIGDQSFSEMSAGLGFSRYFDPKKRYRFDINLAWVWSSFANSLAADHRYYAGGVFRYYFPEASLPGYRIRTRSTTDLEVREDLEEKEKDDKKIKIKDKDKKEEVRRIR